MKKSGLKLTNIDKVFWPDEGYTKGDVIAYYDAIAATILPYLKDRAENLNRHPGGIAGPNFYQKNFTYKPPAFVKTKKIWSDSNDAKLNYLLCQNKETLLYLANLGCIEINPWASRINSLDKPDFLTIDIDPNGRPFSEAVEVALAFNKLCGAAQIPLYPKTSGKTGLHLVVPLGARYTYGQARRFAELLVLLGHKAAPRLTTLEWHKEKRNKKIFLDIARNGKGQTTAAAYCVRPYPGATVSTPLEWKEVKKGLDPKKFTIKTIFPRLKKKGDLFKGVLGKGVDLRRAIVRLEREVSKR